jgi:signal transduction histidine kinase
MDLGATEEYGRGQRTPFVDDSEAGAWEGAIDMAATAAAADPGSGLAPGPARWAILAVAFAGCAAAACSVLLLLATGAAGRMPHAALVGWITLTYVLCGLVAWVRRPDSRLGPLMIAAGFAPLLSTLSSAAHDVPYTVGEALRLLPIAVFLHLFLAYPSGRLEHRLERVIVLAGYIAAVGFQLIRLLLDGFGPENLIGIVEQPGIAGVVRGAQVVSVSVVALTALVALIAGKRGAGRPLRRSRRLLVDFFALTVVMLAIGVVLTSFGSPGTATVRLVTFALIGLAPLAFLFGLLRARLARSAVGELLVELREDPAPEDLRDALARALGDPSISLAYWLPDFGVHVDAAGQPVASATEGARSTTVIEHESRPVALLEHDAALDDEPELLEAATAAAGIALENARLHAELRARLDELYASRARVLEASQKERQRLERNLHDGAQQRLIALSLDLSVLGMRLGGDADAQARLERARNEIATSLEELRDVAHGLHPAVVSGHGLAVALESLVAEAPIPVTLAVDLPERLPEQLEVAAYYIVSESLANIGKHAKATSASIDVSRSNGQVSVEIVDDGIGGVDTEAGSGLRGLADRVEALGGKLRVWSPEGGGTRLRAEMPCG